MAKHIEISDEAKSMIGFETPSWTYEVTTTSIRAFARGVGYTDLVYYDEDAAKKAGYRTIPAPPTYLGTPIYIPGQSSERFGEPRKLSINRVYLGIKSIKNGLDGNTAIEYFDTIYAGDLLSGFNRLADLNIRDSQSLGKILLVRIENIFQNQNSQTVAIRQSEFVFY